MKEAEEFLLSEEETNFVAHKLFVSLNKADNVIEGGRQPERKESRLAAF